MAYHARLVGPGGQIYWCEHNHRTQTAAVTCANSSATRGMAEITWRRAAAQAARVAAQARLREQERAAAEARGAAAKAGEAKAKAAKRAEMLAAIEPQRAWKLMTPDERVLKTAMAELDVYGQIVSLDVKSACQEMARRAGYSLAAPRTETVPPRPANLTQTRPAPAARADAIAPSVQAGGRQSQAMSELGDCTRLLSRSAKDFAACCRVANDRLKTIDRSPQRIAAFYSDLAGEIQRIAKQTEAHTVTLPVLLRTLDREIRARLFAINENSGEWAEGEIRYLRAVKLLTSNWIEATQGLENLVRQVKSLTGHSAVLDDALHRYGAQLGLLVACRGIIEPWRQLLERLDT